MKYKIQETESNDCIVAPMIDPYLAANYLYMIDEFNMLYKGWNKPELKIEADEKFNEMVLTVRLRYPFKQNAHYTTKESGRLKKAVKLNHDLSIGQRDFKIEVKYL